MSGWKDKVSKTKPKKPKNPPVSFSVRPKKKETFDWVVDTATKHCISVNSLIDAILEAEREKDGE